ncbi:MAG: hypothetical protein A2Z20_00895 [Bdellovibrionales bacterium RBG_16_40_8]|nr:MAG: hypothetical protein A2Z20_00895 [Bdellovibrionales bacterium RBG_16_40_8]
MLNKSILKTIEIKDSILIGRDPGAQIYLPDFCVSNRHARIEKKSDGFYVRDLRSRNGTFINGSRIIEAKLQDHDRLRVGLTEYIFTAEKDMGISNTFLSSQNASWDQQLKRLPAIAQSPHPVLLLGPSGTGKEILANMIHKLSFRSSGQFLSVNCSALTDTLAESELFGHQKGSFTGAQEDRKGAFEAARGGTLFLDEVGDIPLSMQPKFLRALDNNEIKPVGNDSSITIDVRIVAATNRNLKKLVDEGKFREDLYFRLHILQICPPALIERLEDFDSLIQQLSGPLKVFFAPEAMKLLRQHTWPGNIRELKNVISRASALFPGLLITENEIPDILDLDREPKHSNKVKIIPALARQYLHEYEREAIVERLSYYKGNQRRSAQDLGLAKSTLHDRIRRYNICLNDFKEKSKDSL